MTGARATAAVPLAMHRYTDALLLPSNTDNNYLEGMMKIQSTPKHVVCRLLAATLLASTALAAQAAAYPEKPIHFIVPYAAGGTTDLVARVVGERVAARLGKPVVIENKPGAGGNIGMDAVAKSAPDGYTLGMGAISTNALNPHVYKSMAFDPRKDFTARSPSLPNVPTMAEAGVADYAVEPWFGVYGPAGMSADIVQTLPRAYSEALEMPEVKEKLLQAGFSPRGSSARELADLSRSEYERLGKVARSASMTAE